MKIYTLTGDGGKTSLIGGARVSKDDPRIDAYGTVDELSAHIGFLIDQDLDESLRAVLIRILERLMVCASRLAAADETLLKDLPLLKPEDVTFLEESIDKLSANLPPVKFFTLPYGHQSVSAANIARTVCRRAERAVVRLSAQSPVENVILSYLNRLSDYLYVLSRKIKQDFSIDEKPWIPE